MSREPRASTRGSLGSFGATVEPCVKKRHRPHRNANDDCWMTGAARSYETIRLEIHGRVARLTLDRPSKLNALDPAMLDELLDALALLARNDDTNTLMVTGAGRSFCAGVDIDTTFFFQGVTDDSVFAGTRLLNLQHRLIEAVYELPQLTIAGINGDAVGGAGFGLAMVCDMRVAVRTARFRMVPGMLDVIQDYALSWLLQRQIGNGRTLHLATFGDPVTAGQAEEWGFVEEVVDDVAALEQRLAALETHLGTMGADALRMLKLVVRAGAQTGLHEQLGIEAIANGLTFQSCEFKEKHAAYLKGLDRMAEHS